MTEVRDHQNSELSSEVDQVTGSCELSYDIKQKIHCSSSGSHESLRVGGRQRGQKLG